MIMKVKFLSFILAALLIISGCGANNTPPASQQDSAAETIPAAEESDSGEVVSQAEPDGVTLPTPISKTVSDIVVSVDPMIEMLSVVQYLSEYDEQFDLLTNRKLPYHYDLEEAFREFEDHETVRFFNDAMLQGFSFDSPPTACLYLDENFGIQPEFTNSDYQCNRLSIDMDEFRDKMKQFYIDTDFGAFYQSHNDFYNRMIDAYAESFPQGNMIEAMEGYYGKEMAGYHIVLVSLYHPGGFGPALELADGVHVYSIQGPYGSKQGTPLFGDSNDIAYLVTHEFGHSFVPINELDNPAMVAEVQRSEYLMDAVREDMTRNDYGDWTIAYEELVLRAAVIDITKEYVTIDLEALLQHERDTGFAYIDVAYKTILQYSQNREIYPVFDDFVPVITDALLAAYER